MKKNDSLLNYLQETNSGRRVIYDFLARVFAKEVSANFLIKLRDEQFQAHLADLNIELDKEFFSKPDASCLEELAVEYSRLFLGPGQHISPHESVHHIRDDGDFGSFWGKSTTDVKSFIESAGLIFQPQFTGIPDHISVELEFMRYIVDREADALKQNDRPGALYCLKMGKKFIDEHLAKWVSPFCDKVIEKVELSFYGEITKLCKWFIEYESNNINNYIELVESN